MGVRVVKGRRRARTDLNPKRLCLGPRELHCTENQPSTDLDRTAEPARGLH